MAKKIDRQKLKALAEQSKNWPAYRHAEVGEAAPEKWEVVRIPDLQQRIRELEAELAEARECNEVEQYARLMKRIQQLEAELQVRDNMGNEVLRILREATGKRDFHSEMEAAEWAAKMLAEARLDSARLDWLQEWMKFGRNDLLTRYRVFDGKVYANLIHPDDAMGAKAIPGQDNIRAAIDAAMKVPQ